MKTPHAVIFSLSLINPGILFEQPPSMEETQIESRTIQSKTKIICLLAIKEILLEKSLSQQHTAATLLQELQKKEICNIYNQCDASHPEYTGLKQTIDTINLLQDTDERIDATIENIINPEQQTPQTDLPNNLCGKESEELRFSTIAIQNTNRQNTFNEDKLHLLRYAVKSLLEQSQDTFQQLLKRFIHPLGIESIYEE